MFRVLVVDDDPDINEVVREGLRVAGYGSQSALTGEGALAEIDRQMPDPSVDTQNRPLMDT